jgi:hypothetical protein
MEVNVGTPQHINLAGCKPSVTSGRRIASDPPSAGRPPLATDRLAHHRDLAVGVSPCQWVGRICQVLSVSEGLCHLEYFANRGPVGTSPDAGGLAHCANLGGNRPFSYLISQRSVPSFFRSKTRSEVGTEWHDFRGVPFVGGPALAADRLARHRDLAVGVSRCQWVGRICQVLSVSEGLCHLEYLVDRGSVRASPAAAGWHTVPTPAAG